MQSLPTHVRLSVMESKLFCWPLLSFQDVQREVESTETHACGARGLA